MWICDTRDPLDWAIAMKDLGAAMLANPLSIAAQRQQRLERYDTMEAKLFDTFSQQVCDQVLEGFRSKTAASGVPG